MMLLLRGEVIVQRVKHAMVLLPVAGELVMAGVLVVGLTVVGTPLDHKAGKPAVMVMGQELECSHPQEGDGQHKDR